MNVDRLLWLFNRFLPQRYCAGSAFVIDADGQRDRLMLRSSLRRFL